MSNNITCTADCVSGLVVTGLVESFIEILMIIVISLMLSIYAKTLKTKADGFNRAIYYLLILRVFIVLVFNIWAFIYAKTSHEDFNLIHWQNINIFMFHLSEMITTICYCLNLFRWYVLIMIIYKK